MSEPAFQTEVSLNPEMLDVSSIRVRGRATLEESGGLRRSILDEIAVAERPKLVLELSGIRQIDTAGAAVLVEAVMAAKKRGVRILLCSPSESVTNMFRLAGFEEVLDYCCPNPQETRRRLLN